MARKEEQPVIERGEMQYQAFKDLILKKGKVVNPTGEISDGPERGSHSYIGFSVSKEIGCITAESSRTLADPEEMLEDLYEGRLPVIVVNAQGHRTERSTIYPDGKIETSVIVGSQESGMKQLIRGVATKVRQFVQGPERTEMGVLDGLSASYKVLSEERSS